MRYLLITIFISIHLIDSIEAKTTIPKVFIDCQMSCYINYIKEQINFVDYMQDRQEANIYILATSQVTGAGGREIQLVFEGNDHFIGMIDTLKYIVDPNTTELIERDQLVHSLKRGLLNYIVQTDMIKNLNYSIESDLSNELDNEKEKDPWNYWVFNIGGHGWLNGEESYTRMDLTGHFSVNRITDKNKFEFSARHNFEKNTFTLSDGEEYKSILKSYNLYFEYVKSINSHLSIGAISRSGSSTFGNTDVSTTIKAAIEFNIYPYSASQTSRFSFLYTFGPDYYDYTEPTIYEKEKEWASRHGLKIEYQQTQKWGKISFYMGVQQYLNDLNLYNAYLNPYVEWQIEKGLSINFGGFFSFVKDRINIAKSNVSDEDIILKVKQLNTDFSYYSHIGVNYRFGSKYNNFVNPRF